MITPKHIESIFNKPPESWSMSEKRTFLNWLGMEEDVWDKFLELSPENKKFVRHMIDHFHKIQDQIQSD